MHHVCTMLLQLQAHHALLTHFGNATGMEQAQHALLLVTRQGESRHRESARARERERERERVCEGAWCEN